MRGEVSRISGVAPPAGLWQSANGDDRRHVLAGRAAGNQRRRGSSLCRPAGAAKARCVDPFAVDCARHHSTGKPRRQSPLRQDRMALFQRSKPRLVDRVGGTERQDFSLLVEHRYAGCDRCPQARRRRQDDALEAKRSLNGWHMHFALARPCASIGKAVTRIPDELSSAATGLQCLPIDTRSSFTMFIVRYGSVAK